MVRFRQKGDFSKLNGYFERVKGTFKMGILDKYGQMGVDALSSATPVDTGKTAESWEYKIQYEGSTVSLSFWNTNKNDGVPIAIILQYGHATGSGGWVQGRDFIRPAIRPIFDKLAEEAWKEVAK